MSCKILLHIDIILRIIQGMFGQQTHWQAARSQVVMVIITALLDINIW